jgi:flagellar hook-associated protein 2
MATTSVSNTSTAAMSTTAQVAAANKANAQQIMTKLGAGSGVDVTSLAQNLVDAEKMPKANAINAKIAKNDSRISGYSAVSFVVNEVQTALTALKDQTSFSSVTAVSSNPGAFSVSAGATAATLPAGALTCALLALAAPRSRTACPADPAFHPDVGAP